MKKFIYFICCFFFMTNVAGAVTFTCPEFASPGEVIRCHLEEGEITGMKAQYQLDSGVIYQGLKVNDLGKSYYDEVEGFSVGNVSSNNVSFDIDLKIGMDVKINQDYYVRLVNVEKSTLDYQYNKLEDISSKIFVVSDVNTLDNLAISNGTLSPDFDKNITSYKATVKSNKVVIKAIASDSSAKVEGDIGEKILNYGGNTFSIKVTSVRGNAREYKLYITRLLDEVKEIKKSSDISLKSLFLSQGKIDFQKDKFLYDISVNYDIQNIEIEAIPNSDKAKVEIEKPEQLVVGENTVKINVTAEDGTVGTYVIVVNRKEKLSSDNSIKSLVIKGYELDFKSDIYQYNLQIDGEEKLDINIELNDEKAKYKIKGNNNLKNKSIIEIEVTAEDGSKQGYKINIIKVNENNSISIISSVKLFPLVGFILLIIIVLVIKKIRNKITKNKDNSE